MAVAVFTYGTLMSSEVMYALTQKKFEEKIAFVSGYVRRKLINKLYPGIVADDKQSVEGKLYLNVDEDSLTILSCFEDDIYDQITIDVFLKDSRVKLSAQAYVIPSRHSHFLSREPWSEEEFRINHLSDYVEMCKRFRAQTIDP